MASRRRPLLLWQVASGSDSVAEEPPGSTTAAPLFSPVLPTLRCGRCGVDFPDVATLRNHHRTSHGPAAAGGVADGPSSDEEGDETDTEEAEDSGADAGAGDAAAEEEDAEGEEGDIVADPTAYRGPLVSVTLPAAAAAAGTASLPLWVHRCLLESCGDVGIVAAVGDRLRRGPLPIVPAALCVPGESWAVFMFQSGFFAAAVYEVAPPPPHSRAAEGLRSDTSWPRVLMHKRFHRYTTRRKQGGSQSAHDAKGGAANSAGAQLRRAGEKHLAEDIAELLTLWAPQVAAARRIAVACPRAAFHKLCDGKVLRKGDPRIMRVPFATSRPTLLETERVVAVLSAALPDESAPPPPPPAGGSGAHPASRRKPSPAASAPVPRRDSGSGAAVSRKSPAAAAAAAAADTAVIGAHVGARTRAAVTVPIADMDGEGTGTETDSSTDGGAGDGGRAHTVHEAKTAASAGDAQPPTTRDGEKRSPAAGGARNKASAKGRKRGNGAKELTGMGDRDWLDGAIAYAHRERAVLVTEATLAAEATTLWTAVYHAASDAAVRVGMPAAVLRRYLSIPETAGAVTPAVLTRLQLVQAQLATLTTLLLDGLPATAAAGAVGWEELEAVLAVASAGVPVDWDGVGVRRKGASGGGAHPAADSTGSSSGDDDGELAVAVGGAGKPRGGRGAKGKSKGKGKSKSKPGGGGDGGGGGSVRPAPPAPRPPPTPTPPPPVAVVAPASPHELMRQAALARLAAATAARAAPAVPAGGGGGGQLR